MQCLLVGLVLLSSVEIQAPGSPTPILQVCMCKSLRAPASCKRGAEGPACPGCTVESFSSPQELTL